MHYDSHAEPRRLAAAKLATLAETYRIPLPQDAGVVTALSRLDSTDAVPSELYSLIADVLAFVHRMDAELSLPAE